MNTRTTLARVTPGLPVLSRIAAAMAGGYAFCWGFIAFCMAGTYALGLSFHDAEHLASMLGMLIFLCVFLWAFSARSVARVWAVLLVGGAAMAGAASLIQHGVA